MKVALALVGVMLVTAGQGALADQAQGPAKTAESSADKTTGRKVVPRTDTRNSSQNRADQKQQALRILDQLSDLATSLKVDEWTLRLRAHIADLLWNSDRERARRNF